MPEEKANRVEGVDFTDIDPLLEGISYPLTTDDLVAQYGDHTISRTNVRPIAVRELFEGTGEETFDDAEEIRQSLLNLMPRDSVGRVKYSDRGGSHPRATDEADGLDDDVTL